MLKINGLINKVVNVVWVRKIEKFMTLLKLFSINALTTGKDRQPGRFSLP